MLVHEMIYQGGSEDIAFLGKTLVTYGQLQEQVQRYRNYFYQQGIRPGENVGLFAKNSVEFIYSYLAIVSLGAIVVPLNFLLVPREIAYILQDAGAKILITMSKLDIESELKKLDDEIIIKQLVTSEFSEILAKDQAAPAPEMTCIDENRRCVIIYTSGTTGKPKGAVLTHKNLVSNVEALMGVIPISKKDNILCVLPLYHSLAWTCTVLFSLLKGATVTLAQTFSKEIVATIKDNKVTIVYAVPSMYKFLAIWGTAQDFSTVRLFISGGSSLPATVIEQFYQKCNVHIVEGYGLSEASPIVSVNPPEATKLGSIGKPLPGVAVKVVDEQGKTVLTGEVGELLVSGPNVMLEYYNLPEETAKTIQKGWLHTGDLACRDGEGYLYIKDRLKDMIISSGENIYPREIEELLYQHPSISEAAAIGIPDRVRGQVVCAFLVMKEGCSLDKKLLREYLQANLALYKVPKSFVELKELPKNSTGKILKKVLREQAKEFLARENKSK